MFKDKILLITGGTGSFGKAVLKLFLNTDIGEIRIFSRDEKKQDDMRNLVKSNKISYHIGDIRDFKSVSGAMNDVDYIFHAAALKQVPSCEYFPIEAVKTNILGTENVLNAALAANVNKVICLSTDKAVYPINAMGLSKAMMEKVFVAKARSLKSSATLICGTRYGNVMASRSSVIPLFIQQIKSGEPLTITEPSMTRFMMSLEEAVQLVMFAFDNGKQGDVFVQKSPSCTIGNLAVALKELFHAENELKIIGKRPGEKFCETLISREEMAYAIEMKRYFRIPMDNRSLTCAERQEADEGYAYQGEEYNSINSQQLSIEEIKEKLLSIDFVKNELARAGLICNTIPR